MQFSNLSALSLSELKALATANNAIPTGDKRSKKAWIDALELAQAAIEYEECTEVAEFFRENPDAEGGFFGEYHSYTTTSDAAELAERGAALDLVEPATDEEFEAALSERECLGEVSDSDMERIAHGVDIKSNKKGAATVFGSLLCILILTIQSVLTIGCAIVQAAIHLKNLFGAYNPDYDLFGQLHDMVRERKLPIQQTHQPA